MNEMVSITKQEYDRLRAAAEDLVDLRAYDRAAAALAAGADELIPAEYANRLVEGESPVRVYRELRGLTQVKLAEKAEVNRVQIANIEAGTRSGSIATMRKLADALEVTVDDLI